MSFQSIPNASTTVKGKVKLAGAIGGTSDSVTILGASSAFPDMGTTTLAQKMGNAYLGTGKDLYPSNDIYGMFDRLVNYGFTPDEHWKQNADELAWVGWASYTGFVTPASITTSLSSYSVAHNSGVQRAFRYRAAATGGQIFLRARAAVTFLNGGGLMMDDGVNNADGNGANNFYRVFIKQSALAGAFQVFEQFRTGGGAVTTNTGPTIAYGEFTGVALTTTGTLWTSWSALPSTFGEAQSRVQFTGGSGTLTWTPARVGLFAEFSATDFGRRAVWDWYDEATS